MYARRPDSVHGLEFDHVVLVEPADWVEENAYGKRLLFVCMTRATKTLHVLHHRPLPSVLGIADFETLSSGHLPSRP
ncbi:MAG: ATP-binding domain-containing protein [Actinomycetota bacterium]|nr:ATP-binding domain-containing protein [Actinomycetota bacterium]